MGSLRRILASSVALAAAVALSACTPTLSLDPAPDANNPLCAEITARLGNYPAIATQERRWTNAQATGAWGNQTIILSCGVPVPGPTADYPCVRLGGVDWLVDAERFPTMRMTSYGRDPAVQVWVETETVSSNLVLTTLGPLVTHIPATAQCIAPDEASS